MLRAGGPASLFLTEEVDSRSAWRRAQGSHHRVHRVHHRIGVAVCKDMSILIWARLCRIGDIEPHTK